jgi:hypothetical protein
MILKNNYARNSVCHITTHACQPPDYSDKQYSITNELFPVKFDLKIARLFSSPQKLQNGWIRASEVVLEKSKGWEFNNATHVTLKFSRTCVTS